MAPMDPDARSRVANILVIVALVAMLIGAVTLVLAREETPMQVPPGEEVVVLKHTAREWDPWGASLRVRVFGPANVTLTALGPSGADAESENRSVRPGFMLVWEEHAQHGETWTVVVQNHGNHTVGAAAMIGARGNYWVGGALAALGLFGFVFHRLGMRRSG